MKGSRLCLLVDQFEELFQYIHEGSLEEATLFVDLIASALEDDAASPLRIILTMRSDFLGECVRWPKLAEAVNRAQYLLPPMGQTALQEAICRPAELYQGKVDLGLADRMIGDAQGEQDQLPLIQHALMRLWDLATVENGARHLDSSLYEKHGPLTRILDEHADEVARIAEPGTNDLPTVSGIFRALSDLNDAGQPIRRQQTLKDLSAVTGAPEDNVRAVVDAFRTDGVSFLKPYGQEALDDREPIDISHEALMRCWNRLADRGTGWLWDEFRQGLAWRSLLAQAELFLTDSRNVLSPPTTEDRQRWLDSRTEAWATRYGDSWGKVAALMDASRAYAHRQRRNLRLLTCGLILLALLVTGGIIWAKQAQYDATQALDKLYTEQARVMWSELGSSSENYLAPRQLYALWQVADADPKVREKFVKLLSEERELAARFGAHAAVISRAIGLDWPQTAEQAETVLKGSRDAIGQSRDASELLALTQSVEMLAPSLTAEQAAAELDRMLDMIRKTTDFHQLNALWRTIQMFAPRMTPEQAAVEFGRMLDMIRKTTDLDQLNALWQTIQMLIPGMKPERAQSEFELVLDTIGTTTDAHQLEALALAARELAPRLAAEQKKTALARLLELISKVSNLFELGWLVQAAATLDPTTEQAQTVLGRVLDPLLAIPTGEDSALETLAQTVVSVAPSLTAEQTQTTITLVFDTIKKNTNLYQLIALQQAIPPLVQR
jgi:hypothetical protein